MEQAIRKPMISTDKEIREPKEDSLDFKWFAYTLRRVILSAETPITIGVYGEWGAGKTSVMWMTKESLKEEAITIWFNAWKYDKVYDLRVALIQTILKEIAKDKNLAEKVQDFAKKVNWLSIAKIATSFVLGSPTVSIEDFLKQDEMISVISEFDNKFNELVKKYTKGKALVVFIDDLDRCLPEKSIDILEAIKLFLDAEGCVFVIGANKRVIEEGIKVRYKGMPFEGTDYMEKIVQIPFNLPELSEEDAQGFIEKIAPQEIKEYKEIMAKIGGNPRRIKRVINKFILQSTLAEETTKFKVDRRILAKLSVIELRWGKFYGDLIKYYDKDLKTSLLLKELRELIDLKDDEKVKEKLKGYEMLRKYYEDKTLINFLNETPKLWEVNLQPYIYLRKTATPDEEKYPEVHPSDIDKKTLEKATANDQYSNLRRILLLPEDKDFYGRFYDYGYWTGTEWHGYKDLPPGYWVYVYPYWFIWGEETKINNRKL